MADANTVDRDTILAKWKELTLHPFQNKWTIADVVLAIIIASTISFLWTRVLHEIATVDTIENIKSAISS